MPAPTTLLVVEDDAVTREGLDVVLHNAGSEVVLAANGEEGLESLRSVRTDRILLDRMMPVLAGWHFLERLKAESAGPPSRSSSSRPRPSPSHGRRNTAAGSSESPSTWRRCWQTGAVVSRSAGNSPCEPLSG